MLETKDILTLVGLVVTVVLGLVASLVSRRHDREQQARAVLLEPAAAFARATLAALASLRYISPPRPPEQQRRPHRNEALMSDPDEQAKRLSACEKALDEVRETRAHVRLVFHPKSWAAHWSAEVLEHLRTCLETAARFYADANAESDEADDGDKSPRLAWRVGKGKDLRDSYRSNRHVAYVSLDSFFADVATRLVKPTWDPKRIREAPVRPGAIATGFRGTKQIVAGSGVNSAIPPSTATAGDGSTTGS